MDVFDEARLERRRAHQLHGSRSMEAYPPDDLRRLSILLEEVGEVARELNEASLGDRPVYLSALRLELVQVCAMAGAWAAACTALLDPPPVDRRTELRRRAGVDPA